MTGTTENTTAVAEVKKTTIRPNVESMVKTAGGSYHKADFIGSTLAGLTVAQVRDIAKDRGIEVDKYNHLNPGQQRMTLGNSLRKMTTRVDETGLEAAALTKAQAANEAIDENITAIENLATKMKAANEEAEAETKAAKLQAKVDAAAKKDADKAAKAEAAAKAKKPATEVAPE